MDSGRVGGTKLPGLFLLGFSAEIGVAGIHQESIAERLSPQKHSEAHLVAICQGELDRPGDPKQTDFGQYYRANRCLSAGTSNRSRLQQFAFDRDRFLGASLYRMDFETDPFVAITLEILNVKCVER